MRLRDAIIDKSEGWLACGPVVVAALTGSRLSQVEALFRAAIGSNGRATTRPTSTRCSPPSA
jgi:hypothetical protein